MDKNIKIEIKKFCNDAEAYTSWRGVKCWRTFGGFSYYVLMCQKLGLEAKCLSSGLHYEAIGGGVCLEYCEGDITLNFETLTREEIENTKNGEEFVEVSTCGGDVRLVDCSLARNYEPSILFGCWLQDGKDWQVLGYCKR